MDNQKEAVDMKGADMADAVFNPKGKGGNRILAYPDSMIFTAGEFVDRIAAMCGFTPAPVKGIPADGKERQGE